MTRAILAMLLGTLSASAASGPASDEATAVPARSGTVEILRYVELDDAARRRVSAELGGAPDLEAYVVVVHLEPGRHFISARVDVLDGLLCIPRRRRAWSFVGKLAMRLGYEVATSEAPAGVRETLGALPNVLPGFEVRAEPKQRLRRRVTLKAADVEHHEGYVATVVLVAGSPFTRLRVGRVVTRPVERGRRGRVRASTVVLPDREERAASPEAVRSILGGRRGRPRSEPDRPPW